MIAIKQDTISSIEQKFGREQLERIPRDENTAGSIEALSEPESRAIIRFGSLDALGNRPLRQEGLAALRQMLPGREYLIV